jgi:hypothetical protein
MRVLKVLGDVTMIEPEGGVHQLGRYHNRALGTSLVTWVQRLLPIPLQCLDRTLHDVSLVVAPTPLLPASQRRSHQPSARGADFRFERVEADAIVVGCCVVE